MVMLKSAAELLLSKTYEEVWYRGQEYADQNRVSIQKTGDKEIEAVVRGTKEYAVHLRFAGNILRRDCSCPYPKGICKHMVAVAILWDEMRGFARPTDKEISSFTIAKPQISQREISNLFDNPIGADLDKLRILVEFTAFSSSRLQNHARLPNCPKISSSRGDPLTRKEVIKAFKEMERWASLRSYDHYFCAGEMAAAFCELLNVIETRLSSSNPAETILIMADCVSWYYRGFNQIIDGSDGVWIFPLARIGKLVAKILQKHPQHHAWKEFRIIVEETGDWWGKPSLDEKVIATWENQKL